MQKKNLAEKTDESDRDGDDGGGARLRWSLSGGGEEIFWVREVNYGLRILLILIDIFRNLLTIFLIFSTNLFFGLNSRDLRDPFWIKAVFVNLTLEIVSLLDP